MYTPPASNYTGGFGPACGGSGDTITTGFRAPFHKSFSQLSALTTARRMIDQGTYRSSACPYECLRKITRHEVVPSNEANMLSGLGMLGEGFIYPGHDDDPGKGFSRYASSGEAGDMPKLHPLHMSHNVTMDQCDEIVHRHQLLAPHGVWLVNHEHEAGFATGERLGDCGLFLGARSAVDADIWRAFYKYARMILRLGHVDTWFDDDIIDAIVHTSSEKVCNSALSKVCLWWSEFDLDDEEYSCRPKRDASNIVTPSILLATLAENRVAYPPPSPPPPFPPSLPPAPSPPPGSIRCELSGVASTKGYKVPAFDAVLNEFVPVQKKCWRWDASNDWPPFVAHRDLYRPRDRCSGDRSRDVQWDGGFRQSILSKNAYDSLHQNNDDCPWKSRMGHDYLLNRGRMEDGAKCSDGSDGTKIVDQAVDQWCTLGTNLQSCGIRKNLVVFGYGYAPRYMEPDDNLKSAANAGQDPSINYWANTPFYKARDGFGTFRQSVCIGLPAWSDGKAPSTAPGKWVYTGEDNSLYADIGSNPAFGSTTPLNMRPDWDLPCRDGGPGSEFGAMCYYGTDANCGKRRFAFEFDQAGPDIPDNSCVSGRRQLSIPALLRPGATRTAPTMECARTGSCGRSSRREGTRARPTPTFQTAVGAPPSVMCAWGPPFRRIRARCPTIPSIRQTKILTTRRQLPPEQLELGPATQTPKWRCRAPTTATTSSTGTICGFARTEHLGTRGHSPLWTTCAGAARRQRRASALPRPSSNTGLRSQLASQATKIGLIATGKFTELAARGASASRTAMAHFYRRTTRTRTALNGTMAELQTARRARSRTRVTSTRRRTSTPTPTRQTEARACRPSTCCTMQRAS